MGKHHTGFSCAVKIIYHQEFPNFQESKPNGEGVLAGHYFVARLQKGDRGKLDGFGGPGCRKNVFHSAAVAFGYFPAEVIIAVVRIKPEYELDIQCGGRYNLSWLGYGEGKFGSKPTRSRRRKRGRNRPSGHWGNPGRRRE